MKIGAIIICRYSSSRLPGKILKEVDGLPILQQIINRLSQIKNLELVVATSDESSDDIIYQYCQSNDIQCYRGSLQNVSQRFLQVSLRYNLDYAIRVNGDNLFIDIDLMEEMIGIAATNKFNFLTNVKERTFPYGMSIEIVKTAYYQNVFQYFNSEYYQEHVTSYLYENEDNIYVRYNTEVPEAAGLKLAIDTTEDFKRAKTIVSLLPNKLYEYSLEQIVNATKLIDE